MRQRHETYFTMRQLLERYSCSRSTIERMIRNNEFPRGRKMAGGGRNSRLRFAASELYQWERKHGMESDPVESTDWLQDREWLNETMPREDAARRKSSKSRPHP